MVCHYLSFAIPATLTVIPAQAGIQWTTKLLILNVCLLDSRLRGNDERGAICVVMYKSCPLSAGGND